tara:strand:- start:199 stop:1053 length:855 start_codon:yes stop_codon:yes gene_type:complete
MQTIKFSKYTGAGNNYIFVDGREINHNWNDLAKSISDKNFGIGSDGLIVLDKSDIADFEMIMFNADGSEGEMCGNGVRCMARFAEDVEVIKPKQGNIKVSTKAGIKIINPYYENNIMTKASVDMGAPIFDPTKIPVLPDTIENDIPIVNFNYKDLSLKLYCVNTGVPHCIAYIDEPVYNFELEKIGPLVEKYDKFPQGVNFEIVNKKEDKYIVRVWERGSGITLACGTGATAVAAISKKLNLFDDVIHMNFPGGDLSCNCSKKSSINMEGPIEHIGSGTYNINL